MVGEGWGVVVVVAVEAVDGSAESVWPGPTKLPVQLPMTFTNVTTSLPEPTMLLLTKLTRLATILASPV